MKESEKKAKLEELQRQMDAIRALPTEPDDPLMVLPRVRIHGEAYRYVTTIGDVVDHRETGDVIDGTRHRWGNYFHSSRQALAFRDAVATMQRLRQQPGIVGADLPGVKWRPVVDSGRIVVERIPNTVTHSNCMFPCYSSEAGALAAIEAVGGEDALRKCAEYWSGRMR